MTLTYRPASRTHRAVSGALTGYIQYVLQILLQFLLAPLVLRVAGAETLGAYAVVAQVVGYVALLDLGFSATMLRFLSHATGAKEDYQRFRDVLTTGRTFLTGVHVLMGLACFAISLVIGPLMRLNNDVAHDASLSLMTFGGWNLLRGFFGVAPIALLAKQDIAFRNAVNILTSTSRAILSLAAVYMGLGLLGLAAAQVCAEVIDLLCCNLRFRAHTNCSGAKWGIPDADVFKEMLRYSGSAALISVAVRLVFFTDQIVVGTALGAVASSAYYATQMPATMGWQAVFRISDSSAPAVNQIVGMKSTDRLRAAFLRLNRYTFMLSLPLAFGILMLNKPFVTLWISASQFGGHLLNVSLAAFAVMVCTSHVSGLFVLASGDIRTLSRVAFLEGLLNIAASLILVAWFGIGGVMLATTLTHLISGIYAQSKAHQILDVSFSNFLNKTLVPSLLPSAISALALLLATYLWPPHTWAGLFSIGSGFIVTHACMLFCFSFDSEDRLLLASVLSDMRRRERT